MKIKFVDDLFVDGKQPERGDAVYHSQGDVQVAGITFCCPGCGRLGGVSFMPGGWTWDGNREAPTVQPSILHDNPRCGWHGYLTNGEFVPC